MKDFLTLKKLQRGDQVAIISPSAGLPGLFPWVQDLGLQRLRDNFGLIPKEYPTTRMMGSSLEDRARDVMAAFSDPANKAVFASIGGEDQIKLIKYLDPVVFTANPKPFFGYSDNTHLHNFLWSLGIPSYYGGGIMTEFAFQQQMSDITVKYLNHALFDGGEVAVDVATEFNDIGLNWADQENLQRARVFEPNSGLLWDGERDAEGILWGGCVESLTVQSSTQKYMPSNDELRGTILFIETAEDLPDAWIVEYLLTGFGERGWFDGDVFQAVLVGRPKAWEFDKPNTAEQKAAFKEQQQKTVVSVIREYNQTIPIIQNLDFGHTAPQIALPYGGRARIDSTAQKIFLSY
ncbi:MAG: putative Peptidase LD-carboxypeptidase [Candidatus Saccharibacteria bacterium]|nr:putative Peptidase LD-carboxypeptidase [Candidatus Saccharibacteria bacterium]